MSEHEKEMAFLRQCILHDNSAERHKLEESITQLQGNERCIRRATGLMGLLIALSLAGLCYSAVCIADLPQTASQFMMLFISKVFCVLGLGSLICLFAFLGLAVACRRELAQRRDECRRLAAKVFETRKGLLKEVSPACVPSLNSEA